MIAALSNIEIARRLILAAVLGAIFGLEREVRQKSAGLRTNILIAVGAAVFTMMSIEMAVGTGADPSRIASQIVTGVGFLGAGAIMRTRGGVQGLTTAATVWVNAAVGVAAGRRPVSSRADRVGRHARRVAGAGSAGANHRAASGVAPPRQRPYCFLTLRGTRGASSGTAGRPASTQAAVIIDATSVMASDSRFSRIGRVFPKNSVKY